MSSSLISRTTTRRVVVLAALAAFALAVSPADARARVTSASSARPAAPGYELAGRTKWTKQILREAGSGSAEQWFEQGREAYDDGHYDSSASAYLRAAAGGYRKDVALYNAACSFALDGQKDEALQTLQKALDAGFDDLDQVAMDSDLAALRAEPRYQEMARRSGVAERAAALKRDAVATFEELQRAHAPEAGEWGEVGVDLLRLGDYERARQAFAAQYALDDGANPLYNSACASALAGDRRPALDMLERAILAGYSGSDHMIEDADLAALRDEPRFKELIKLSDDLELNSSPGIWKIGHRGNDREEWQAVVPRYERITRERPTVGRAWFNLGYAQIRAGHPEEAAASYRKTLELKYREPTAMYNLACAYAQAHKADDAFSWLERAETAGLKIGQLALNDDDLDPLRRDPRFKKLRQRWEDEMEAEWRRAETRHERRKHRAGSDD